MITHQKKPENAPHQQDSEHTRETPRNALHLPTPPPNLTNCRDLLPLSLNLVILQSRHGC